MGSIPAELAHFDQIIPMQNGPHQASEGHTRSMDPNTARSCVQYGKPNQDHFVR